MGLNIKNEETHQLVLELAALTGETQTMAVANAVREKLSKLHQRDHGGLSERLIDIGRDVAIRLDEPQRSMDHGALLYDENGLPA